MDSHRRVLTPFLHRSIFTNRITTCFSPRYPNSVKNIHDDYFSPFKSSSRLGQKPHFDPHFHDISCPLVSEKHQHTTWQRRQKEKMDKNPKCDFFLTTFGTSRGPNPKSLHFPVLFWCPGFGARHLWSSETGKCSVRPRLLPLHSLVHFESGMF